jgi:branched-chain amino acid transport system ATP-binding protein
MNVEQLLELKQLHTFYGSSHILFGISLIVQKGECVCLLGRNGVGKTTTLKSIIGIVPPKDGQISYCGKRIDKLPSYEIARLGIGYVPDERLIFPDLTVLENLEIGIKESWSKDLESWNFKRIFEVFPNLEELKDNKGGYLSGGEQQMLTIGRTLMGNPTLLLLDEPVEGLAPVIVKQISEKVKYLKKLGLSILFAEQNLGFAMEIADKAYVIEGGIIRFEGSIDELKGKPEIKEKYLMV